MKQILCLFMVTFVFMACEKVRNQNDAEIQQFISDNNLNAVAAQDGLYYVIDSVGTGASPNLSNSIEVKYTGYYTDGEQFDGTPPTVTRSFPLANLIKGWQYGFPYFNAGGSGKLLIPSHLGYGSNPPSGIRSDAVLIFDVELVSVQ